MLILIGKDDFIKKYQNNWSKWGYNEQKTSQENVGFSHTADIQEAIDKLHNDLSMFSAGIGADEYSVLDIGCGVGLYLQDFPDDVIKYGTDLNPLFIDRAQSTLTNSSLHLGDYFNLTFDSKFDLIYSVSVIQYVAPSKLNRFFGKMHEELNPGGKIFIQYPHALSNKDLRYADLSYVQYSPTRIEKAIAGKFQIIQHQHSFDKRKIIGKFDDFVYGNKEQRNFRNGYLLKAIRID